MMWGGWTVRVAVLGLFVGALAVSVVGCGGGEVRRTVRGRIHMGGEPLKADPISGRIEVAFLPFQNGKRPSAMGLDPGAGNAPVPPQGGGEDLPTIEPFYADIDENGQFEIPEGMPDGKYLVTVRVPVLSPDNPQEVDKLGNRFDVNNSNIIIDVSSNLTNLDIDLSDPKYTLKKKKG